MHKNHFWRCVSVTFGLLTYSLGSYVPTLCTSNAQCKEPNMYCKPTNVGAFTMYSCDCQGATSQKPSGTSTTGFSCEPITYSYFDHAANQWTCPAGIKFSATTGSCCPPLMEPVNGACKCVRDLVLTKGVCVCPANPKPTGSSCPSYTYLQGQTCQPYTYAVCVGGAYVCPKGAYANRFSSNRCACWGYSTSSVSNGMLTCTPYPGTTYNAARNIYQCGPGQYYEGDKCVGDYGYEYY